MSIRTVDPTCRICGRALTDIASRYRRVGSDCWSKLDATQQAKMLELAAADRDPFHIPELKPASLRARLNNLNARRAVATPGEGQLCHHENEVGKCGDCRRENDPARAAEMILRAILKQPYADRRADRMAVQAARVARGIPAPRPARRREPATRPVAITGPEQMELT